MVNYHVYDNAAITIQNLFYCPVGFHIQGILLGMLVHNNKQIKHSKI